MRFWIRRSGRLDMVLGSGFWSDVGAMIKCVLDERNVPFRD